MFTIRPDNQQEPTARSSVKRSFSPTPDKNPDGFDKKTRIDENELPQQTDKLNGNPIERKSIESSSAQPSNSPMFDQNPDEPVIDEILCQKINELSDNLDKINVAYQKQLYELISQHNNQNTQSSIDNCNDSVVSMGMGSDKQPETLLIKCKNKLLDHLNQKEKLFNKYADLLAKEHPLIASLREKKRKLDYLLLAQEGKFTEALNSLNQIAYDKSNSTVNNNNAESDTDCSDCEDFDNESARDSFARGDYALWFHKIILLFKLEKYEEVLSIYKNFFTLYEKYIPQEITWQARSKCPAIYFLYRECDDEILQLTHIGQNFNFMSEYFYYAYQASKKLNQPEQNSYLGKCFFYTAKYCYAFYKCDLAKNYLEKAIKNDPINHQYNYLLGEYLQELDINLAKINTCFNNAIDYAPDNNTKIKYLERHAEILMAHKEDGRAFSTLKAAKKLKKNNSLKKLNLKTSMLKLQQLTQYKNPDVRDILTNAFEIFQLYYRLDEAEKEKKLSYLKQCCDLLIAVLAKLNIEEQDRIIKSIVEAMTQLFDSLEQDFSTYSEYSHFEALGLVASPGFPNHIYDRLYVYYIWTLITIVLGLSSHNKILLDPVKTFLIEKNSHREKYVGEHRTESGISGIEEIIDILLPDIINITEQQADNNDLDTDDALIMDIKRLIQSQQDETSFSNLPPNRQIIIKSIDLVELTRMLIYIYLDKCNKNSDSNIINQYFTDALMHIKDLVTRGNSIIELLDKIPDLSQQFKTEKEKIITDGYKNILTFYLQFAKKDKIDITLEIFNEAHSLSIMAQTLKRKENISTSYRETTQCWNNFKSFLEERLKNKELAESIASHPLTLLYGKRSNPLPIHYPTQYLVGHVSAMRDTDKYRNNTNFSGHSISLVYSETRHKNNTKQQKIIIEIPINYPSSIEKPITNTATRESPIKRNETEQQQAYVVRIRRGKTFVDSYVKSNNQNANSLLFAKNANSNKFTPRDHTHSEQAYYDYLDNISINEFIENIQKIDAKFKPGCKVYAIIFNITTELSSCDTCKTGAIAMQNPDSRSNNFLHKLEDFLKRNEYILPGKNAPTDKHLKSATRILAKNQYSNSNKHTNPSEKNLKFIANFGIFETVSPSVFASGSQHNLLAQAPSTTHRK